jgi:hypothetical protein
MGTIVVHAGRAKTGSSSLQSWLSQNADTLRQDGVCVLAAHAQDRGETRQLSLTELRMGQNANVSHAIKRASVQEAGQATRTLPSQAVESLVAQLAATASRYPVTVISGEILQRAFAGSDRALLAGLDQIAGQHQVRVAYYVRPQHTALEAEWCQSGYRSPLGAAEFLARESGFLHYHDTLMSVGQLAPNLSFEPRPFHRDLLYGGHPAADFAHHFLGRDARPEATHAWLNRGLPLEVMNALHRAPEKLRSSAKVHRMKETALADLSAPESGEIVRSRRLLQAYCHSVFESGNRQLLATMGWDAQAFVPAADAIEDHDISHVLQTIEDLWEPKASPVELAALYASLEQAISRDNRATSTGQTRRVAKVGRALATTLNEVARAEADLRGVRASRGWRLASALTRLSSAHRRDALAVASKRLRRTTRRLERIRSNTSR